MPGVSPTRVYVSVVPCCDGVGSPVACVMVAQFELFIIAVEYLMSYRDAVPWLLSSPGALHDTKSADVCVMFDADRLVVRAGGVVSVV